jgi:hypothetical protein
MNGKDVAMAIERLSDEAIQRISGPSWEPLKQSFLDMSEVLLDVAADTVGVLTTIYVKYQLTENPSSGVFAVAWLKTSKQIVVGLTLPENFESPLLGPAPKGTRYKGLTKYFTLRPGDLIPEKLSQWALAAYQHALAM